MAEDSTILIGERTEPSGNAPAGKVYIWMTADGHLWSKTDDGTTTDMGASATEYSTFLSLLDTPSSYVADQVVRVNSAGTALELADVAPAWEAKGEGIVPIDNKEIAIGDPEAGRESVFGEGDSYNDEITVLSYDGTSYVDVTAKILTSGDGQYAEFPNLNAGTMLYVCSNKLSGAMPYPGLKLNFTQAGVPGTGYSVTEYWTGSAWVEFTKMLTESSFPYLSHANVVALDTGSYQMRFNHFMADDWAKTTVDGLDRYWTRMRIVTGITQTFHLDHLKVHTSRTEINADGFMEFFGWARPIKQFFINFGSFNAAASSPSDQDVFVSDNLDVGFVENRFVYNAIDRSGLTKVMPLDLDTSTPIKIRFKWATDDPDNGYIRFVIRWGYTSTGSAVFNSSASAPTVGPNEQSLTALLPIPLNNEDIEVVTDVYLSVEDIKPEIGKTDATSIWITFERTGTHVDDTHTGDVVMHDVEVYYVAWRLGGMVNNY